MKNILYILLILIFAMSFSIISNAKERINPSILSPFGQPSPYLSELPLLPNKTKTTMINNPTSLLVLVNKTNSLPENYQPTDLVVPKIPFYFTEELPKKLMRKEAAIALAKLFQQATRDGIEIYAASGYRSYQRQKNLFTYYSQQVGENIANQRSARPGQSEHQTGLAIDITSRQVGFLLVEHFGETPEGIWLAKNAPKFGFILRYPKGKEQITRYQYEPWHIRYVGGSVAMLIAQKNITLEEYLLTVDQNSRKMRNYSIPNQQKY